MSSSVTTLSCSSVYGCSGSVTSRRCCKPATHSVTVSWNRLCLCVAARVLATVTAPSYNTENSGKERSPQTLPVCQSAHARSRQLRHRAPVTARSVCLSLLFTFKHKCYCGASISASELHCTRAHQPPPCSFARVEHGVGVDKLHARLLGMELILPPSTLSGTNGALSTDSLTRHGTILQRCNFSLFNTQESCLC